jgi:act minimal PKS acyl carrier protein
MVQPKFTIEDLKRILRSAAGTAEGVNLDDDIMDQGFDALGYESLALMETGSHIEREYGITLGDSMVTDAETPRQLLEIVNSKLTPQYTQKEAG